MWEIDHAFCSGIRSKSQFIMVALKSPPAQTERPIFCEFDESGRIRHDTTRIRGSYAAVLRQSLQILVTTCLVRMKQIFLDGMKEPLCAGMPNCGIGQPPSGVYTAWTAKNSSNFRIRPNPSDINRIKKLGMEMQNTLATPLPAQKGGSAIYTSRNSLSRPPRVKVVFDTES